MSTSRGLNNLSAEEIILAAQFADAIRRDNLVPLASSASLDRSPKSNWVQESGQLPRYIREVARALERKNGWSLSRSIAVAISRIKVWAVSPETTPQTKAKAVAAVAQWEALRAKNKARMAKNVALSDVSLLGADETDVVALAGNVIRRVRTPEGARRYGQPVGSVIVSDGKGNVLKVLHKGDGTLNGPSAASFQNDPKVAEYGTAKKGEFKSQSGVTSQPKASPVESKAPKSPQKTSKSPQEAPKASPVSEASGPSSKASKPSYHGIRPGDYTEDSFTPQDVEQRAKDIDAHLDKVLADGDTRTRFSSPTEVDGVRMYTPERKALHKEILSDMVAQANQNRVPRDGQAYISGGLPGAGKSYVLKNRMGLDTSKYVTLNPDDFKEMLANRTTVPGTEDGSFSPMEMAAVLHEESSDLSKAAIDLFTSLGYNVILDVTLGGSGDKAKAKHRATVERLRSRGYSVDGVFVDIPHTMSRESAGARYLRGFANWLNGSSDMGGRYVPAHVAAGDVSTMGFNSSNRDNFESVKDLFRDFRVVDNSVRDRAAEMRVLDNGGSGRSTASSDPFVSNNFDPLSDPIARLEAIIDSMRVT